jgi:hypothetical protein
MTEVDEEGARELAHVIISDCAVDPKLDAMIKHAAHTIFRGYICAGCPLGDNDISRHALVWLGQADPGPSPTRDRINSAQYIKSTGWNPKAA